MGLKGFSSISLLVILATAIILGIGAYILSHGTTYSPLPSMRSSAQRAQAQATPDATLTSGEITSSIPDIVGHGQNLECEIKIPIHGPDNPFSNGKLWTSGGKGRSTISAHAAGIPMDANAIYQNGIAYTWIITGGQKIGMKFNPDAINDADMSLSPQQRQQAEQLRSSMLFTCQPWAPDDTKFQLPADVEFQ
jgi:hypothetical protein